MPGHHKLNITLSHLLVCFAILVNATWFPGRVQAAAPSSNPAAALPTFSLVSPDPAAPEESLPDVSQQTWLHAIVQTPSIQTEPEGASAGTRIPSVFVPNRGQVKDGAVRFQMTNPGESAVFLPGAFRLSLSDQPNKHGQEAEKPPFQVEVQYLGANPQAEVRGSEPLGAKAHFLNGDDPTGWLTEVETYGGMVYRAFYPGIDLQISARQDELKSSFVVSPGADPMKIRWKYQGAREVVIDGAGNLQITAKRGEDSQPLTETAPVAWQEVDGQQVAVPVQFALTGEQIVSFELPSGYDPGLALVIDPTLVWGTYLGGESLDKGWSVALDSQGNVVVAGHSSCYDYPVVNPLQPWAGGQDVIISKLDPSGTTLLSSTCLGGSSGDYAFDLAIGTQDGMVVTGYTQSSNFPNTAGLQSYSAGYDIFVAKLNAAGNQLLYSTYLGGSGNDVGESVVVDSSGKILLSGYAGSTNFPTSANAYATTNRGSTDAIVAQLDPSLTGTASLLYSSYLGGSGDDRGRGIALDGAGRVYLVGNTNSSAYPVVNAIQSSRAGNYDAFVTQMDLSLSGTAGMLFSTYYGGGGVDQALGIALDSAGKVYLAGYTQSTNFPATSGAYQTTQGGGCTTSCEDGFISKLDLQTRQVVYATYLGGSGGEEVFDLAVSSDGKVYATGYSFSSDYPTLNPLQSHPADSCGTPPCSDGFVSILNATGSALAFSSYLGGSMSEEGEGITLDGAGNSYLVGWTNSSDFPTTPGHDTSLDLYGADIFVVKLSSLVPPPDPNLAVTVHVPSNADPTYTATWTAVNPALVAHYEVQLAESGHACGDLANLAISGGSTGSQTEVTDFGPVPLTVCVQAVDGQGNRGAWASAAPAQILDETSYYSLGGQVVAMERTASTTPTAEGELYYLGTDQLGSVNYVMDASGSNVSQTRYTPFGEELYQQGLLATDKGYTGQRADSYINLIDFGARWYDPLLGRFISADTIIPDPTNPLDWDRYQYVRSNPINYNDPSGHMQQCADGDAGGGCGTASTAKQIWETFADPDDGKHKGVHDGLFAEYYAKLFVARQAISRNDSNVDVYVASAAQARDYAMSFLPQKEFNPFNLLGPDFILKFSGAMVNIAKDAAYSGIALIFGPNPNGINGKLDHQITVSNLRSLASQEFGPDVIIRESVSIKNDLGIDRRPDVSVWDINGNLLKVYEAGRVDQNGNFVAREQRKMYEYYEMGIPYYFEEVK